MYKKILNLRQQKKIFCLKSRQESFILSYLMDRQRDRQRHRKKDRQRSVPLKGVGIVYMNVKAQRQVGKPLPPQTDKHIDR